MHEWFVMPQEDEHFPDAKCDYCSDMLRWCPICQGYHHLEPEVWISNHWHNNVMEGMDIVTIYGVEKPITYNDYVEALKEVIEK